MSRQYVLRHERHAIGEFAATMNFRKSLAQSQIGPILEKQKEVAARLDLPATLPLNVLRVSLNVPGSEPLADGHAFQRFQKDGSVEASLVCDDDTVTFTSRIYDRWHIIAPTLRDIFAELADVYLPAAEAIKSVRIQYLNEFRAATPDVKSATELFQKNSKWIAPFALDTTDFWHCHIGQFIPVSENKRNLVNVNSDVLDAKFEEDVRRYVKVLVLAGCYYDIPGKPGMSAQGEELRKVLESDLNEAHALERQTLAEVISDEYLEPMGALNRDY